MNNPYLNRGAITEPRDFYGRLLLVRRIFDRMESPSRPQSVAIVGDRRIGKSSLLCFIHNDTIRSQYLIRPSRFVVPLVDLQLGGSEDVQSFYHHLITITAREAELELPPLLDKNGFERLVDTLEGQNKRLVILFDEFERLLKVADFDPQFFSFMRGIADKRQVAYVTASDQDPRAISDDEQIVGSPFWNIFTTQRIGGLALDEAYQLIAEPSDRAGYPLKDHAALLISLAGHHPYLLQIACELAYEQKRQHGKILEEGLSRQFLENSEVQKQASRIWNRYLSDAEKDVLTCLVQKRALGTELAQIAEQVEDRGYLIRSQDGYRIFSPALETLVRKSLGLNEVDPTRLEASLSPEAASRLLKDTTRRPFGYGHRRRRVDKPLETGVQADYRRITLAALLLLSGMITLVVSAIMLTQYQATNAFKTVVPFGVILVIAALILLGYERGAKLIADLWLGRTKLFREESESDKTELDDEN